MGKGGGGGGGGRSGGGGFRSSGGRARGFGHGRSASPTRGSAARAKDLTPPPATIKSTAPPPNNKPPGESEKPPGASTGPHTSSSSSSSDSGGANTSNPHVRGVYGGSSSGHRGSNADRCRDADRKLSDCLHANPFDRQACQAYVDALAACRRQYPR